MERDSRLSLNLLLHRDRWFRDSMRRWARTFNGPRVTGKRWWVIILDDHGYLKIVPEVLRLH